MTTPQECVSQEISINNNENYQDHKIRAKSQFFIDLNTNNMDLLKSCIAETIAYILLVICIFFCEGTRFVFGFWTILMVFGNISGAHINPIITFSLWIYNGNIFQKDQRNKMIAYYFSQMLGAIIGAGFCYLIYGNNTGYVKCPQENHLWNVLFVECFFSGTFCFVALFICSPTTRPTNKNYVNLTILSVWLLLIIEAGKPISGASYNPTFYLILNLYASILKKDNGVFSWYKFSIYYFSPYLGALIFTLIFKFLYKPFYVNRNKNRISHA